jgi:hypothetical protein
VTSESSNGICDKSDWKRSGSGDILSERVEIKIDLIFMNLIEVLKLLKN